MLGDFKYNGQIMIPQNSHDQSDPNESHALIDQSLQRLARAKRRDSLTRWAALVTGLLILVLYVFVGALTGMWGIGLLCVPFAVWLVLLGVMAIGAAFMAGHS